MIRSCTESDFHRIHAIINQAAEAYRGVIPDDCWHEPYMTQIALRNEIAAAVDFWGWEQDGELVGVMGIQQVRDATLVRHAYVHPDWQGRGIGGALLKMLTAKASGLLLVGTWAAATWAIRLYERHGFLLVDEAEKDRLLGSYWKISSRQTETSVVLKRS